MYFYYILSGRGRETRMGEKKTKLNCWEVKKCDHRPGGIFEKVLGTCPATQEERGDRVHDGTNAGSFCWGMADTLCKGEVQGTIAHNF